MRNIIASGNMNTCGTTTTKYITVTGDIIASGTTTTKAITATGHVDVSGDITVSENTTTNGVLSSDTIRAKNASAVVMDDNLVINGSLTYTTPRIQVCPNGNSTLLINNMMIHNIPYNVVIKNTSRFSLDTIKYEIKILTAMRGYVSFNATFEAVDSISRGSSVIAFIRVNGIRNDSSQTHAYTSAPPVRQTCSAVCIIDFKLNDLVRVGGI